MKKLKLLLAALVIFSANATFAQSKGQAAKMKQRLMTELKIDEVKADSVVSIVEDFYSHARSLKSNTELKDDERKLALQNNRKGEMTRLRAQLNPDQIKKLQQVMQDMKDERQHRKAAKDSTSA